MGQCDLYTVAQCVPFGLHCDIILEVVHNLFEAIIDLFRYLTTGRPARVNLTIHSHLPSTIQHCCAYAELLSEYFLYHIPRFAQSGTLITAAVNRMRLSSLNDEGQGAHHHSSAVDDHER